MMSDLCEFVTLQLRDLDKTEGAWHFAKRTGVDDNAVRRILQGNSCSVQNLEKIIDGLGYEVVLRKKVGA